MTTHSITLARKIPRTEEPGGLQSMGSQSQTRLSDWAPIYTHTHTHTHTTSSIFIHLSVDIEVVFMSWLLWIKLLWTLECIYLFKLEFSPNMRSRISAHSAQTSLGGEICWRLSSVAWSMTQLHLTNKTWTKTLNKKTQRFPGWWLVAVQVGWYIPRLHRHRTSCTWGPSKLCYLMNLFIWPYIFILYIKIIVTNVYFLSSLSSSIKKGYYLYNKI